MPDNKKHHYVPKFYLRRFNSDVGAKEPKLVNVFNLKRGKVFANVSLKDQCYRDYFYGEDNRLESELGRMEGVAANLLRLISELELPPPISIPDIYLSLIHFILVQVSRTAYQADQLNELFDHMARQVLKHSDKIKAEDLEKVKISLVNPAAVAIGHTASAMPLLLDLHCKLIIAPDGHEFATSDRPVVLYNQLLSFRTHVSNTGFASKGLQIFFPISPKHLLMLFDANVYIVGERKAPTIRLTDPLDIQQLNILQAAGALDNLYFSSSRTDIFRVVEKATPYRQEKKGTHIVFPTHEKNGLKSELLMSTLNDVRTNLQLSFVKMNSKAKDWLIEFKKIHLQPVVVERVPGMVQKHQAFMKELKEKAATKKAVAAYPGQNTENGGIRLVRL